MAEAMTQEASVLAIRVHVVGLALDRARTCWSGHCRARPTTHVEGWASDHRLIWRVYVCGHHAAEIEARGC